MYFKTLLKADKNIQNYKNYTFRKLPCELHIYNASIIIHLSGVCGQCAAKTSSLLSLD